MSFLFGSSKQDPLPVAPVPVAAPKPVARPEEERAAAARARRLAGRPLMTGSPLGVQPDDGRGLQTTLGPRAA
jgi:hypothetical protein